MVDTCEGYLGRMLWRFTHDEYSGGSAGWVLRRALEKSATAYCRRALLLGALACLVCVASKCQG
eukprot:5447603-Alexandrium_andersonii.AAC.1